VPLDGTVAQRIALVDIVNSLLDKGTVISGQATVSVAGVDLIHVALNLLVSSVETLHQTGRSPILSPGPAQPGPARSRSQPAPGGAGTTPAWISAPLESPRLLDPPMISGGQLLLAEPPAVRPEPGAEQQRDQGLAGLVLALVELIRQLLERQAVRRMEGGALTEEEVERMGRALMELNAKMKELFAIFGLDEADVNLDLGPFGQLL
jgi:hypothetical protein